MFNMNEVYRVASNSNAKQELISIIRAIVPEAIETYSIVCHLQRNPIFDSTLRLEVACKLPGWYHSFEIVDDIIACSADTDLMKRLYAADVNGCGAFVAVQIKDSCEIEKMYQSGIYEIQCAAVSNMNASLEFLERVIRETDKERIREYASETFQILKARQTEDPDEIEDLYIKGSEDVQLAAVGNIHARCEFLEGVVFDTDVAKAIRHRAYETFEKISST